MPNVPFCYHRWVTYISGHKGDDERERERDMEKGNCGNRPEEMGRGLCVKHNLMLGSKEILSRSIVETAMERRYAPLFF